MKNQPLFILTFLFLLLAALIIPGLNDQSLWGDEGWSVRFTDDANPRTVAAALVDDRHPPLYFWMLGGWRLAAGDDEIALRMLAVLGELLTAAVLFAWGRAQFNPSAGLAALLIFALLDKQVVFSQEARHYTWLMLWTATSSWALIAWLRQDRPLSRWGYFLTLTVGLYTHSFMLIVLLAQGIFALMTIRRPSQWIRLGYLWLCAGLAFSPWGLVFYFQYTQQGGLRHDFPFTREIAEILIHDFLGAPVTLFVGLLLIGLWMGRRQALLPLLGLSLPILVVVGLPQIDDEWRLLTDRNLAIIIPPLALLIGLGVTAFKGFARGALVAFLLVNGLLTTDTRADHPPMRPIARQVAAWSLPDQPIIFETGGADPSLEYHLRQEGLADHPLISILDVRQRMSDNPAFEPFAYLRFEALGGADGFWYVHWSNASQFLESMAGWGYTRTMTEFDTHLGGMMYLYRYDSVSILQETVATWPEGLRLHRVRTTQSDDQERVFLWWSADSLITSDYRVSVFTFDSAGRLLNQHDGIPSNGAAPMHSWPTGALIFDPHILPLGEGSYSLNIKVYNGSDGQVLHTTEGVDYVRVGQIEQH